MKSRGFRGGIHPYDGKSLSKDGMIHDCLPSGDLVYPLAMHIGKSSVPVVAKGDRVLAGQKIAEAEGFVSVPVHASVSGEVKAIERRNTAVGTRVMSIVVSNDHQFEEMLPSPPDASVLDSKEEILKVIQNAGIIGMGGAGFPTHVKLSPKNPDKIEYIIANCAECEPYITSDYRCMLEMPGKIVGGMQILLKLFDHAKGVFAIEDNKKDCAEALNNLIKDESRMKTFVMKTKYPQGAERMTIYAVTGRAINSDMLPADAGVIVDNAETLIAVYEAVMEGRPLTKRVITVSGDSVAQPGNYRVPIGMNHIELLEAAGGCPKEPSRFLSGGPMMGFAMYTIDTPVTKTTSAFLCFDKIYVGAKKPDPCISCGRCVSVCPENLVPSRLARFAERGASEEFIHWNGMECCECGCCSYICPAQRQLKQTISTMRQIILSDRRNQKKAAKGGEKQ